LENFELAKVARETKVISKIQGLRSKRFKSKILLNSRSW